MRSGGVRADPSQLSTTLPVDYGHHLEFGFFLVPEAGDPAGLLETGRLLDQLGYDLVGVQDHRYQRRFVDTYALPATILAQTTRSRVFADVTDVPLRPPAVLAKQAATLDLFSSGRFELGLGASGFLDAAHAMGAPARTHRESLDALEEAVAVARAMWSDDGRGLRFDGRHYQLAGVHPGPTPAHPIQVWVGANKPQALALTGRLAEGWVSPLMSYKPPREAAEANTAIDRAALDAGRDPRRIRRIYNVQGAFTLGPAAPARDSDPAIVGPPEQWVERLTSFATELGFGTFVLVAEPDPATLRTFIEKVAPRVRAQVDERRAASNTALPIKEAVE
jgi:alkanesulfonate monooxygenase SsuD/methylene tetrahydromethanopterin reductase-like flavin-dependent oxidoreductase (luciferase family)